MQKEHNAKVILALILLLTLAQALCSCRSSKSTVQDVNIEQSAASSTRESASMSLDSLIATLQVTADTLDIWITPAPSNTNALSSTSYSDSIGVPTAQCTPHTSNIQARLHIRAVGLQARGTTQNISHYTEKCSSFEKVDSTVVRTTSIHKEKKPPVAWRLLLPIILVAIGVIAYAIYLFIPRIRTWTGR